MKNRNFSPKALVLLVRPRQYIKNGFLFLPLIFGNKLLEITALYRSFLAFVFFCAAASAVYIFNDIIDVEEDRKHPQKCSRPLASGEVAASQAMVLSAVLGCASLLLGGFFLGPAYLVFLLGYFFLNIAYSLKVKRVAILDVVCISIGFVIRVLSGAVVIDVSPSKWIIIMTFLLAMFLGLAKRRDDLLLAGEGNAVRKAIDGYSFEFVSASMVIMAAVIIVSYLLYTVSPEVIEKHHANHLYLTSFWVILGLLRYLQITFIEEKSGSPTSIVWSDRFIITVVFLWISSTSLMIYT